MASSKKKKMKKEAPGHESMLEERLKQMGREGRDHPEKLSADPIYKDQKKNYSYE